MTTNSMIQFAADGSCRLSSPTQMPLASAYLWNQKMMVQYNCRGYVTSQFMQPEPAKYSTGPNIEATTFMQPEQPYFSHYPGRFFYLNDVTDQRLYSVPYEPCRVQAQHFEMRCYDRSIQWLIRYGEVEIELTTWLGDDEVVEYWSCQLTNLSAQAKQLKLTPYFTVGYMSWMNQQGDFDAALNTIICQKVTPYQKVEQYFANQHLAEKTFLWADHVPDSWQVNQAGFEGEGGLHNPTALTQAELPRQPAIYQTPVAAMQYAIELAPGQRSECYLFAFGAAKTTAEISKRRQQWANAKAPAIDVSANNQVPFKVTMPSSWLSHQVNHWLFRQVRYHGESNRLTTDPQTRNFLQDALGYCFVAPSQCRSRIITALSQQLSSGQMPDGVLLHPDAKLKYINQVPHTDHCVWLPMLVETYLQETNDYQLLNELVPYADSDQVDSVQNHICGAMDWLDSERDERGLSYIAQGDWCDPMNMVGYQGKGVSAWLTIASGYACQLWANLLAKASQMQLSERYQHLASSFRASFNQHCWDGDWYLRGISDDGTAFGRTADQEGRIFLNPQSFALLAGAADAQQKHCIIAAVKQHLATPYGLQMLAPAFTHMHEHIGRVTQKFSGSAENGSVYNHAAAFYVYALYLAGEGDLAFEYLQQMFPTDCDEDLLRRGQLPVFVPNYYRGAYERYPEHAGRSSQLFNTGSAAWIHRIIVQCLFGFVGNQQGVQLAPQLPSDWQSARLVRKFRGAHFDIHYQRSEEVTAMTLVSSEAEILDQQIIAIEAGKHYQIEVLLPR
ncbi:cellobionic acid phosphorylase [Neiella marina]|uniref:Cellobionic acid phosphorylase n=1 Tax=Neiella marina TaxID=508461 RepID=A0A8J2XNU7_9GAMM|nr:amylo-alpha-1,6-glucosidase [Neiella marina]GGA75003.1 cellobionic acid phosphorylase [Neiella marina]